MSRSLRTPKPRRERSPRRALNDRLVASLGSNGEEQFEYFDGFCPGLLLRVSRAGMKTFDFTFRSPSDGKRARLRLGTYPLTDLKHARDAAIAARMQLEAGNDPRVAEARPVTKTVGDVIDDHIRLKVRHSAEQHLRTCMEIERAYDRDVIPFVGDVPIRDFRRSHLNVVIDPIIERGSRSQAANRFRLMRALINFAVERGDIDFSPIAMAKEPKTNGARERFLAVDEIASVWWDLPGVLAGSDHVATILRLELALGQRVGEIAGMRRDEFDVGNRLWTIPAVRSKNKHQHAVPLNDLAWAIIDECLRETNGDLLFPDESGEKPLSVRAINRTLARAQKPRKELPLGKFGIPRWTTHDLRRTVSTQASIEVNGLRIADTYMDHVLNHRSATKRTVRQRHYNHHAFLAEKRAALVEWSVFLSKLISGDGADAMKMAAE